MQNQRDWNKWIVKKKKKKCFTIIIIIIDNLYFIPNNIFTKNFNELIKYKNSCQ